MDEATIAAKLASYRIFFKTFAETVNINDPLPVRVGSYSLKPHEIKGEVTDWVMQYLQSKNCPVQLLPPLVHSILEQVHMCVSEESAREKGHIRALEPVRLMQMVTSLLNEACLSYLDEQKLQSLAEVVHANPRQQFHPISIHAIRNGRRKMEDRHVVISDLNAICGLQSVIVDCSYYAIFDGHAGTDAAFYASAQLQQRLVNSPYFESDPAKAFREAFLTVDDEFVNGHQDEPVRGGTTAVVCFIMGSTLYTAWLGDSQAILVRDGQVIPLVNPHKPERPDEQERISSMGGDVIFWEGTFRVNGQLGVSRAIGDASYKPYVTAEPDIITLSLDGSEDFIVLGCDGLWDTVSQQEAAFLVHQHLHHNPGDVEGVSRALVLTAKQKGSLDNISVVVVFFKDPQAFKTRPLPAAPVSEPVTPTTPQSTHLFSPLAAFHNSPSAVMDHQQFLQQQRQELDSMAAVYGWNATPNGHQLGDEQQWQNSSNVLRQDENESMESVDSQNWNLSLNMKTDATSPTSHAAGPGNSHNPFGIDLAEDNAPQQLLEDQVDLSVQTTQVFEQAQASFTSTNSASVNPFDCSDWQTHFDGMAKAKTETSSSGFTLNASAPAWNDPSDFLNDTPLQFKAEEPKLLGSDELTDLLQTVNQAQASDHFNEPKLAEDLLPVSTVSPTYDAKPTTISPMGSGLNPLAAPFEFSAPNATSLLANSRSDNELAVLLAAANADTEDEPAVEIELEEVAGAEGEVESHETSLDPIPDTLPETEGVAAEEAEGEESEDDWSYFKVEPSKTSSQDNTEPLEDTAAQKQVPESDSLFATEVPSEETPISDEQPFEQPIPAQFIIEPVVDHLPSPSTADNFHIYSSDEPEESLLVLETDPLNTTLKTQEDYSMSQFQTPRNPLPSVASLQEEPTLADEELLEVARAAQTFMDSSFTKNMEYVSDKLSDLQLSPEQERGLVEESPTPTHHYDALGNVINTPNGDQNGPALEHEDVLEEPALFEPRAEVNIQSPVDIDFLGASPLQTHHQDALERAVNPPDIAQNTQASQDNLLKDEAGLMEISPEISQAPTLPDILTPQPFDTQAEQFSSTLLESKEPIIEQSPIVEPVLDAVVESLGDLAVDQVSHEAVVNAATTPSQQPIEEKPHEISAELLQGELEPALSHDLLFQTPVPHFEPHAEPTPLPIRTPAPVEMIQSPTSPEAIQFPASVEAIQSPTSVVAIQSPTSVELIQSPTQIQKPVDENVSSKQVELPSAAVGSPTTEMDIRNGNISPISETAATQGSEPELAPVTKGISIKKPHLTTAAPKKSPLKPKTTTVTATKKEEKDGAAGTTKKEDKPTRPVRLPLVTKAAPAKPKAAEAKPASAAAKADAKAAPIRKPLSSASSTGPVKTATSTVTKKTEVKPAVKSEHVVVKKTTTSSVAPRTTSASVTGVKATTSSTRVVTTTRTTVTRVTASAGAGTTSSTTTVVKSTGMNGDVKKTTKRPISAQPTAKSPVKPPAAAAPKPAVPKARPVSAAATSTGPKPAPRAATSSASSKTASPTKAATSSPIKAKTGTASPTKLVGKTPSKTPTKTAVSAISKPESPSKTESPAKPVSPVPS